MNLITDWPYIEEVARKRLETNQTKRQITAFGETLEIMGAAGELAARRVLGVNGVLHEGFDGGCDIEWCGKRIDVKATSFQGIRQKHLQWPLWKKIKSDYIIMTGVDIKAKMVEVLGYVTAEELASAPENKSRSQPCRELPITELHPMWHLLLEKI